MYYNDKKNKKLVNEIKSETRKKYNELEELYSIASQHLNYRKKYEEQPNPKIPVIAFLIGENIRIETMETFIENTENLNMYKIRKISKIVESLYNAKEISFVFPEIIQVKHYLESLF